MAAGDNYSPYVLIGKLSRDFLLTEEGEAINNIPGGHLLYTAIGMTPWERHPGLISRIGKNFPEQFISLLKKYEFSTEGIKVIPQDIEHRNFISFFDASRDSDDSKRASVNVLSQYFKAGKPFPRELLGYSSLDNKSDNLNERTSETILARDIPEEFREARCIHLCPMDYLSHNLIPQVFLGSEKRTITIHSGKGYMQPSYFNAVKTLINGLNGFIVRERNLRNLFKEKYKISNLSDMMKVLLDYGAENIIVKAENRSYFFINRVDRSIKHLAPVITDKNEKIGELSCFCGAFLAGLNETYDYLKAVSYGAARVTLLRDDVNPYNNLEVFSALVMEKARIMENNIEG